MKIGIVTVHDSANFGSFLQALGVQEMIKSCGHEPYFIQTRSLKEVRALFHGYDKSKWGKSLRGFARYFLREICRPARYRSNEEKFQMYQEDWKAYEHILPVEQLKDTPMDLILFGSDELWNVRKPAFRNPLFYGIGIDCPHKYAYAMSIGDMAKEDWAPYPYILPAVGKFDGIYTRDARTQKMFEEFGLHVDSFLCDPTLQADIRSYMREEAPAGVPEEPYLLVYTYTMPQAMQEHVKRFARERGLKTASITLYQPWCDTHIECGPLSFGPALQQASYVYTSTFHGSIFSSLYHTNFVSMPISPKVNDVLTRIGLQNAIISEQISYEEFVAKMEQSRDYEEMERRILELRKDARGILETIISQSEGAQ